MNDPSKFVDGSTASYIGAALAAGIAIFLWRVWKTSGGDPVTTTLSDLVAAMKASGAASQAQLEQFKANNAHFEAVKISLGKLETRFENMHTTLRDIERNTRQ